MTEAYELGEEEPTYVEVWRPTGLTGQGQWVRIEGLHARSVQLALQPSAGISSATLEYHYGEIDRGDSAGWKLYKPLGDGSSALSEAFGTINPVDLKHRAFRVNMLNGETGIVESQFVGFVTAVAYEQHKPATLETFNDVAEEYGNQIIELAGPEWLLNRNQIDRSDVEGVLIPRGLPFNLDANGRRQPNRKVGGLAFTNDVYTPNEQTAWDGSDAVSYLVSTFAPASLNEITPTNVLDSSPAFTWRLFNNAALFQLEPRLETDGRSLYQLLNDIISPQRMLFWCARYVRGETDSVFGEFQVHVRTGSANAVALGAKLVAPANTDVIELNTAGTVAVNLQQTSDTQQTFDIVEVTGDRVGHVFTATPGDSYLNEDWSESEEQEYNAGVTGQSNVIENQRRTDVLRAGRLAHVYTRFAADINIQPPDFINPSYVAGLRWERDTPLLEGWDYTQDPPQPPADNVRRERMPIRAFYKDATFDGAEWWVNADRMALTKKNETVGAGKMRNAYVRPRDDKFGVTITPTSMPHYHAKQKSVSGGDPNVKSIFNYTTDIEITGYVKEDLRVNAWYPQVAPFDWLRGNVLQIDLGAAFKLDILEPETTVGIADDGTRQKSPNVPVEINDDTEKLLDIARLAYEFFGKPRRAYAITFARIDRSVLPGQLVTTIDERDANVIITQVVHDFATRQTAVSTSYATPDLRTIARDIYRA